MSEVYKSVELVGVSSKSFDDAVKVAVKRAGSTMRELQWFEVLEERGYIKGDEVNEFQVKVRIWFSLDDS